MKKIINTTLLSIIVFFLMFGLVFRSLQTLKFEPKSPLIEMQERNKKIKQQVTKK